VTNRVALVTGASGGIGRAAAVALSGDGLRVACGYASDDGAAKETVAMIEDAGGTAAAFRADVSDEEQVGDMVRDVTEWAEPPLVLVASAGLNRDGLTVKYPAQEWERTLGVNLTGAFLCARACLPGMMKARWGRIIAVSSAAGLRGNAGQAAYTASKHGVIGLVRTLAKEYASRGITANALCPGFIETDMIADLLERARSDVEREVPAGRIGTPEETAAAIRFLAGDDASYINGAVLAVDGGLTA
jgi:3-oxoacyl-[acyl-carrier protein] reductase